MRNFKNYIYFLILIATGIFYLVGMFGWHSNKPESCFTINYSCRVVRKGITSSNFNLSYLSPYEKLVGKEKIEWLKKLALPLQDKKVLHVILSNQGRIGRIVNSQVGFLNALGINTDKKVVKLDKWSLITINKLTTALKGGRDENSEKDIKDWIEDLRKKLHNLGVENYDVVYFHGVGLLPMAKLVKAQFQTNTPNLIWRSYRDISSPNDQTWDEFENYAKQFDVSIFSAHKYVPHHFLPNQKIIPFGIDPLADSKQVSEAEIRDEIEKVLIKEGIVPYKRKIILQKKFILQISTFSALEGVKDTLRSFMALQKSLPGLTEDTELFIIQPKLSEATPKYGVKHLKKEYSNRPNIHILSGLEPGQVSAFLEKAYFLVQPSSKGSIGEYLAEAKYRGVPVITTHKEAIGPRPNKDDGFLVDISSISVTSKLKECMESLLSNPKLVKKMSDKAKQYADHFLLPRLIKSNLDLLFDLFNLPHS